jgi:hypothetical protein
MQQAKEAKTAKLAQAQDAEQARARAELEGLNARRTELKSQLGSLTERRIQLSMQLGTAEGAAKERLDARLRDVDERTGRVTDELNAIDDAINAAMRRGEAHPPSLLEQGHAMPVVPPPIPTFEFSTGRDNNLLQMLLVGQALSFLLLGLILWRAFRRRVTSFGRLAPEDATRLEQLQRSVDVMAVEVERISEGQRYVAKVLKDPALAAGAERLRTDQQ